MHSSSQLGTRTHIGVVVDTRGLPSFHFGRLCYLVFANVPLDVVGITCCTQLRGV